MTSRQAIINDNAKNRFHFLELTTWIILTLSLCLIRIYRNYKHKYDDNLISNLVQRIYDRCYVSMNDISCN